MIEQAGCCPGCGAVIQFASGQIGTRLLYLCRRCEETFTVEVPK